MATIAAAAAGLALAIPAQAQELRVGLSAEASALDPHYHNLTPNIQLATQVFERLTREPDHDAHAQLEFGVLRGAEGAEVVGSALLPKRGQKRAAP